MKENVFERMERIDGQRKISDFIVKQNRIMNLKLSMQLSERENLLKNAIDEN